MVLYDQSWFEMRPAVIIVSLIMKSERSLVGNIDITI